MLRLNLTKIAKKLNIFGKINIYTRLISMNISTNTSNRLNFGATPLGKAQVLKRAATNPEKYFPVNVNFVEMNPSNPADNETFENLKNIWANGRFTEVICSKSFVPNRKIYALTTQQNNCETINPKKVIGLADCVFDTEKMTLRFIQSEHEDYKHAGEALLKSVADNAKGMGAKTMEVFVEGNIKPFYRKVCPTIADKPCTKDSSTNLVLNLLDR